MPSLEEDLARRLWATARLARDARGNPLPASFAEKNAFVRLARECIRQMEWVRHCCAEDQDYGMPAVTLAPEDWKP